MRNTFESRRVTSDVLLGVDVGVQICMSLDLGGPGYRFVVTHEPEVGPRPKMLDQFEMK